MSYQYEAPVDGVLTQFDQYIRVSSSLHDALRVGQEIEVLYLTSDPDESVLADDFNEPTWFILICFGGMGAVFTVIGLGIIKSGLAGVRQRRR